MEFCLKVLKVLCKKFCLKIYTSTMEPIQNYKVLSNLFLITFKLLLLETTATFSRKPFEHLKSTLLTLLHKMRLIQATMLTLLQNMPNFFQKMRLIEAILITTQILQMNPMISTLVNSLAKTKPFYG